MAAIAATAPSSWSTDSIDATSSMDAPQLTPVTSAFGWWPDLFIGGSRGAGRFPRRLPNRRCPAAGGDCVARAGERGSYGNLVVVRDGQGVETRCAHLSATWSRKSTSSSRDAVGRVGRVAVRGTDLHFEVLVTATCGSLMVDTFAVHQHVEMQGRCRGTPTRPDSADRRPRQDDVSLPSPASPTGGRSASRRPGRRGPPRGCRNCHVRRHIRPFRRWRPEPRMEAATHR